jgi:hypothetical protein
VLDDRPKEVHAHDSLSPHRGVRTPPADGVIAIIGADANLPLQSLRRFATAPSYPQRRQAGLTILLPIVAMHSRELKVRRPMRYIQETSRRFNVPHLRKTGNTSSNSRKCLLSRSRNGRSFSGNRIKKTSGCSGRMPIKQGNSRSSSAMSNRRSNCSRDMYSSSSGYGRGSHHRPKRSEEVLLQIWLLGSPRKQRTSLGGSEARRASDSETPDLLHQIAVASK